MIQGLKYKFILINMTIVTAMLLVIFGMVLRSTSAELERQSIRTLHGLSQANDFPLSRPGEPTEQVQLPFFRVALGLDGSVLSMKGGFYDLSDAQSLEKIIVSARNHPDDVGLLHSYNLRFLKKSTPFGQTLVFVDISSERATITSLVKSCIIIGLASFSAFLGLSFLLAGWAVRPVEKAWIQQKQFVADASHELKTPLTVIMTTAEILLGNNCDADQHSQMTESILAMSQQMRGLVDSLLELARVDAGFTKTVFSPIHFSTLASDAILPFEPLYFEQGLQLESSIEENIGVKGSFSQLKQVMDIFLDNALKYSTPGGCVILTLKRQNNGCLLAVSSPGEPISKQDLKNIFRRFYRMDKARTMDHSYGLGLSIAETIVRQHKGRIWAESEGGINTFFVQLPVL